MSPSSRAGRRRLLGALPAIGLGVLLGGCASLQTAGVLQDAGDAAWIQGRMGLRIAAFGTQGARSENFSFELRGDAASGELRLSTPLGTQLAQARWAPGSAELSTAQGRTRYDSLDELSRQVLGEELPLQAMPAWLRGRPWPAAPHRLTERGFEQLDWLLDASALGEGSLVASRERAPSIQLRVRLER